MLITARLIEQLCIIDVDSKQHQVRNAVAFLAIQARLDRMAICCTGEKSRKTTTLTIEGRGGGGLLGFP